jgi:LmbE family N-acetylglucosaminyl deacetylase
MIRTEELFAACRLDGRRQFFMRAFGFGFSKTAEETCNHWPKESILHDVVTAIRAFRPHVIVVASCGTPRDSHGNHWVSAIFAKDAFDAAAVTVRFPPSMTLGLGAWSSSKYYRVRRFTPAEGSRSFNVGELSALGGRTYNEIASQSRSAIAVRRARLGTHLLESDRRRREGSCHAAAISQVAKPNPRIVW